MNTTTPIVRQADAAHDHPTPREFYAQSGRVVLFCLGLALIAHVIVTVTAQ